MRRSVAVFLLLYFSLSFGISQEVDSGIIGVLVPREQQAAQNRLLLSKSRRNYPVTPGDVYELTYRSAGKETSTDILVESDYTLNLSIFGKVNTENMTFPQLKNEVEEIISKAYSNSVPFLEIKSVGLFEVLIKGQVPKTQFATAWGLSRLSEVIQNRLSGYSSIRSIGIVSKDGILKKYDLFKARNKGIVEEDPFVKPGDTIIVYRRDREIEVKGEVFEPGTYQILQYENLEELIENYARGLTKLADKSRIRIERITGNQPQTLLVDLSKGYRRTVPLYDGDTIVILSKLKNLPIVFFEGALIPVSATSPERIEETVAEVQGEYARIIHPFKMGETLYDAILSIKEFISPFANLKKAYLIRKENIEPIPINLEKLIYTYEPDYDIILHPFDKIVIPSHRYFVTVIGAVGSPGNLQYSPGKKYDYYVGLSGGIPPGIDSDNITIFDKNGNRKKIDEAIQPEDMIIVDQSFVSVTGAVIAPGRYDFTPGKTYTYYVDMAGGIDTERNTDNNVTITDSDSNARKMDEIIQPGNRIFVHLNDFIYNFNRYFPVITTGIAFVITIITIIDLLAD